MTVSLHNVTFETALENILRQIDATYRVEAGVYEIVPRQMISGPDPTDNVLVSAPTQGCDATLQDGRYLYLVRGDVLYKVDKSDLKVTKTGSLHVPNKIIWRS